MCWRKPDFSKERFTELCKIQIKYAIVQYILRRHFCMQGVSMENEAAFGWFLLLRMIAGHLWVIGDFAIQRHRV